MAENNSKPATEPQTPPPAPVQEKEVPTQNNTPKGNTLNSSSNSERIIEIEEKLKNNVLTIDERAKLQDQLKNLKEAEAGGVTKQLNGNDRPKREAKPKDFKEGDIIDYMYNQWLIKSFCWAGSKIENGCKNAIDRLKYRLNEAREIRDADKAKFKKTNAYQLKKVLDNAEITTLSNIKKRDNAKLQKIHELASAIGKGDISDKNPQLLFDLANIKGVEAEKINKDPFIENVMHRSIEMNALKNIFYKNLGLTAEEVAENPSLVGKTMKALKKENPEAYNSVQKIEEKIQQQQLELCNIGADFAKKESAQTIYDSQLEQTAVLLSGAQMLDAVAKNGNALNGKDPMDVFKAKNAENLAKLTKATEKERTDYIAGTNTKFITSFNEAAPFLVEHTDQIDGYRKLAEKAFERSTDSIHPDKIQEMGGKPRDNEYLKNLEKSIDKGISPEDTYEKDSHEQETNKEHQSEETTSKPKDLKEEARETSRREKTLKQKKEENQGRRKANKDRKEANKNHPNRSRINRFKNRRNNKRSPSATKTLYDQRNKRSND